MWESERKLCLHWRKDWDSHSGSDSLGSLTELKAGREATPPPSPGSQGGHCLQHRAQVLAERLSQKGHLPGTPLDPAWNSQWGMILY